MRRSVLVAAVILGATACQPQQPTSPADVVASIEPTSVVAGSTFTLTVTATSTSSWDIGEIALLAVRPPSGGYLYVSSACALGSDPYAPAAHEMTVWWTCTIPEGAPNGQWFVQTRTFVEGLANRDLNVPFEVTGGSDDLVGPEVEVTIPATVSRGSSFGFSLRITDDHGPVDFGNSMTLVQNDSLGVGRIECPGAWTTIDATTWQFAATCVAAVDQPLGDYHTLGLRISDAFGQSTPVDITTEVTP